MPDRKDYIRMLEYKAYELKQPLMSDREFQYRQQTGHINVEFIIETRRRRLERDRQADKEDRRQIALENGPAIEMMLKYVSGVLDIPRIRKVYEDYQKIKAENIERQRR